MQPSSWDVNTYHNLVANPTSQWMDSIDGHFPNDRSSGVSVLRNIAEVWCRSLNTHPGASFHPDPPESGFRVVYEDDIPLGLLIGRIGPQRLEQFGVDHGDDLDDNWVPDVELDEGEPGEEGEFTEDEFGEEGEFHPGGYGFDDDQYSDGPWEHEDYPMPPVPSSQQTHTHPGIITGEGDGDGEDVAYDDENNYGGRSVTPSDPGADAISAALEMGIL
ncbi:hypothetical protein IMZ48_44760 [Candidatus Bathyarchaeota archaeon]|nr:hypothetical protein [Candidatus Bathyarchaeota archaeon]